jgi:hypothetical protein
VAGDLAHPFFNRRVQLTIYKSGRAMIEGTLDDRARGIKSRYIEPNFFTGAQHDNEDHFNGKAPKQSAPTRKPFRTGNMSSVRANPDDPRNERTQTL